MRHEDPTDKAARRPRKGLLWSVRATATVLTERFLLAEWRHDAELARRAQLIVKLGMLGFVFGCFYASFYLVIGHLWGAGIIVVCSLAFVGVPFLMRATRSLPLAGNLLPGIMLAGFAALCCVEGGLAGHAVAWMVGVPLWALLLAGKTSAKWWALLSLLTVGAFVLVTQFGVDFPRTYNAGWDNIVFGVGYLGLVVFMFILGIIFENGRLHVLNQLQRALEKLENSNQQLTALNNEKNEFLGIAAHDLKNPLTSIIIGAQMLKMPGDQEYTNRMADGIVDSGRRMRDLIANLLDVNAIEQGHFATDIQRWKLNDLAAKSAEHNRTSATRKEIALEVSPGEDVWARADAVATMQILDNLISNAVKYSLPKTTVRIWSFSEGGKSCAAVKDEGPGISEEDRRKMFGKFTRLTAKPTAGETSSGLGLSIVKRLAESMAGTVECQSELGAGSTFIVRLPPGNETPAPPASLV